jgi:predicted RNase H-like nuclease (RuvC/YqgF family)
MPRHDWRSPPPDAAARADEVRVAVERMQREVHMMRSHAQRLAEEAKRLAAEADERQKEVERLLAERKDAGAGAPSDTEREKGARVRDAAVEEDLRRALAEKAAEKAKEPAAPAPK